MFDAEVLGDEGMLGFYIVVEGYVWEGGDVGPVAWAAALPVTEEGGDDDEVFFWIQSFVIADEPFVVTDETGVP